MTSCTVLLPHGWLTALLQESVFKSGLWGFVLNTETYRMYGRLHVAVTSSTPGYKGSFNSNSNKAYNRDAQCIPPSVWKILYRSRTEHYITLIFRSAHILCSCCALANASVGHDELHVHLLVRFSSDHTKLSHKVWPHSLR